ncbi:hypothetical protein ACPC54_18025 [Kitasatospora sp. NPDC094028]
MRRTALVLLASGLLATTAACSSGGDKTAAPAAQAPAGTAAAAAPAAAAPAAAQDAAAIAAKIAKKVPTAKIARNVTADDDPNHLLGRPHQYTSATVIADNRIDGGGKGVDQGATVEVFANESDAKARAAYIDGIGKAQPMFAEQDFLHGTVLVRVAKALTPAQATEYDKAAG